MKKILLSAIALLPLLSTATYATKPNTLGDLMLKTGKQDQKVIKQLDDSYPDFSGNWTGTCDNSPGYVDTLKVKGYSWNNQVFYDMDYDGSWDYMVGHVETRTSNHLDGSFTETRVLHSSENGQQLQLFVSGFVNDSAPASADVFMNSEQINFELVNGKLVTTTEYVRSKGVPVAPNVSTNKVVCTYTK